LKTVLVQAPLLLQLLLALAKPSLPIGIPSVELILPLTPGLFLATTPFVSLLVR
jgi:hypothetical protein